MKLKVDSIRRLYEILLFIVMLLGSGTPWQNIYNQQIIFGFFALSVLYFLIFSKHTLYKRAVSVTLIILALLFAAMLVNLDFDLSHYGGLALVIVAAMLLASSMPHERFCALYINIMVIVAIYSSVITVYSNIVPSFAGTLPELQSGSLSWHHIGIFYNYWGWTQWTSFIRNSACFREPGVWGCYASLALMMLFLGTDGSADGNGSGRNPKRYYRIKVVSLILGIVLSVSTTAIICLGLCLMLYFVKGEKMVDKKRLALFFLAILGVGYVVNYYGERLFAKLNPDSTDYVSFADRWEGIASGWSSFVADPIFGSGYTTYLAENTGTSANAFVDTLGKYGLFFAAAVFMGLLFWIMKASNRYLERVIIGLIFLVMLGTQSLLLMPTLLTVCFYGYKSGNFYMNQT